MWFHVGDNVIDWYHKTVKDMEALNIPCAYDNIIGLRYINSRATYGYCIQDDDNPDLYTIEISKYLTDEWDVRSILVHELVHTIEFKIPHNSPKFYRWIDKVHDFDNRYLRIYGAILRKSDDLNNPIKAKYDLICQDCGYVYSYNKWCKPVYKVRNYRCVFCHGDLRMVQNY